MKISEMQQIHPEEARMPEPVRNVGHSDIARRPVPNPDLPHADLASQSYDFTFSFEELNTLGFEEAPRHNAVPWQVHMSYRWCREENRSINNSNYIFHGVAFTCKMAADVSSCSFAT